MDHPIIKQIVIKVFEKVKLTSASHKKNALSRRIEAQSNPRISYKTAERAYDKYIEDIEMDWSPNRISVNNFCKYLKYDSYEDLVKQNDFHKLKPVKPKIKTESINKLDANLIPKQEEEEVKINKKWTWIIIISFIIIGIVFLMKNLNNAKIDEQVISENKCMAWARDHYEEVLDCNLLVHPDYGTRIEPFALERKKTMKKVEVNKATKFFSEETGRPLIWYYKKNKTSLEYYTSPGLHPVNGKTLKEITRGMIQKYVPLQKVNTDSFLE